MAESDWSSPSSWSAGGGGMWGAPQGGMQQPYGSPYGGFGGGMAYGGGWGMQSPYGAPGGYGMMMPYGGQMYGGYGQMPPQAPPQQRASPYSAPPQQQAAPQQQTPQQAPQTQGAPQTQPAPQAAREAAPQAEGVDPREVINRFTGGLNIGGNTNQTTTFEPWQYQAGMLRSLYQGEVLDKEGKVEPWSKGLKGAADIIREQQALGPLGFDPSSEAGLKRMEQLANAGNPFYPAAQTAVKNITSGQNEINTGSMFGNMYHEPGITGQAQYQDMANRNAIGNDQQYRNMINQDAIGSGQFNQLYGQPGVSTGEYNDLAHQNAVGLGNYQGILQGAGGPGSLSGGMFGEVARGGRVDSNPYREKAIQDAMNQTSDQVKATMSSRGRYGSDAYGDAMGRALGEVATTARMQGYDTDTAQMMQAAQARSGEDLARQGVGLQAAGGIAGAQSGNYAGRLAAMQGLTGAQSANVAQRMGAAQGIAGLQGTNAAQRLAQIQGLSGIQGQNYQASLGALGQMNAAQQMAQQQRMQAAQGLTGVQGQNMQNRLQAAGMAPAMNQMRYDDATRMLQAGASREAMAQQQRNFGWDQLNQYRSQIGNLPGTAGSQTAEGNKPWWQTALGLASGAAGIWGAGGGA